MSACISRHGEFSSHTLDDSHTCTLCHVLDEEALRAELVAARARLVELENAITWNTSCLSCSTVLDSSLAATERAEKAEADRDRYKELSDDLVVRRRDLVGALRAANAQALRDKPVLDAAEAYRERVREFVGCDYHQWLQDCEDALIAAVDARVADSPRETGPACDLNVEDTEPCDCAYCVEWRAVEEGSRG